MSTFSHDLDRIEAEHAPAMPGIRDVELRIFKLHLIQVRCLEPLGVASHPFAK